MIVVIFVVIYKGFHMVIWSLSWHFLKVFLQLQNLLKFYLPQGTLDWSKRGSDRYTDKTRKTSQPSQSELLCKKAIFCFQSNLKRKIPTILSKWRCYQQRRRRTNEWSWVTIIRTKSFSGKNGGNSYVCSFYQVFYSFLTRFLCGRSTFAKLENKEIQSVLEEGFLFLTERWKCRRIFHW